MTLGSDDFTPPCGIERIDRLPPPIRAPPPPLPPAYDDAPPASVPVVTRMQIASRACVDMVRPPFCWSLRIRIRNDANASLTLLPPAQGSAHCYRRFPAPRLSLAKSR